MSVPKKGKVVAIVPAAGLGKRFGGKTSKPFVELGGRPLIVWSLQALESMPEINEIIPVLKEDELEESVELFERFGISKVRRIAPGGKERQDSVFQGLKLINEKKCVVVVHDGVRPLIKSDAVRAALTELRDCDGVVTGVPVKDTIKEAEGNIVSKTLQRGNLWAVQTPQIFYYKTLYEAHTKALLNSFYTTDDASLVEKYGGRIKVVMGSYTNIKITTPEDLMVAELLLKHGEENK